VLSRSRTSAKGEYKSKGEEKANRDNRKIKNRGKHLSAHYIAKVNRDKNSISASLSFRPCATGRM